MQDRPEVESKNSRRARRRRAAVGVALLALASVAAGADTRALVTVIDAYPHPSPDGQRIVFQSNRSGKRQIWIMGAEGSDLRQLTEVEAPDGAETPMFSPDGEWIVYAAYQGENDNDVFVMRPDGSDVRQLTDSPGYDGHPHWSADGERIVFNSDRTSPDLTVSWSERRHEIFSLRPDGSDLRQHTRCEAICTYGSLSPNGTRVLYRKVVAGPAFNWILGSSERNSEVFTAALDGTDEMNLSRSPAFDGWPLWSPEGDRVFFASNRTGPAYTAQVWSVSADGTDLEQHTEGPWGHAQPALSADGRTLFAYRFQESESFEAGHVVAVTLGDDLHPGD